MQVRKTNEDLEILTKDSSHLSQSLDDSLSNDEINTSDSHSPDNEQTSPDDEDTTSNGYLSNGGYLSYEESDEEDEERGESIQHIRKAFTSRKMDSDKKAFKNKANENNSEKEAYEGGYYIEDAPSDEDELVELASSRPLPTNSRSIQTEYGDFRFIQTLGKGEFGEVALYQYQDDCPAILKFCPNSKIVALKKIAENQHNEIIISDYLTVMEKYFSNEFAYFVRPFYLTTYQDKTVILNEYVPLSSHTLEAKNLQDFLCQLSHKNQFCFDLDGKTVVDMRSNLVVLLAQLVNSIKQSINAVHNCGIFHLDIGCRNFVVAITLKDGKPIHFQVKAIDFGHAHPVMQKTGKVTLEKKKRVIRAMNKNSIANHSSLFLTNNTSSASTKTSLNDSPESTKTSPGRPQDTATIYTELFSVKACIISMLGLLVGMETEWEALRVETPSEKMSDHAWLRNNFYTNDEFTLWVYLQNVKNYINQGIKCKEYAYVYEQVKHFINVFQSYITTLPASNLSMAEARAADDRLLLKTNESLVDGFVEFQTKNLRNNVSQEDFQRQMFWSLEQLREVPVSPEFSKRNSYKLLANCNNDETLRCMLPPTHIADPERKKLCSSFMLLSHKPTLLGVVNNFRQYLCSNDNNAPLPSWRNEVLFFIQKKIDYISYQIEQGNFTQLGDIKKFLKNEKENFSEREKNKDKWSYAFYAFSSLLYIVSSTKAALRSYHQGTNDEYLNDGSKNHLNDLKS